MPVQKKSWGQWKKSAAPRRYMLQKEDIGVPQVGGSWERKKKESSKRRFK